MSGSPQFEFWEQMKCRPIKCVEQLIVLSDFPPPWYGLTCEYVPRNTVTTKNTSVESKLQIVDIDETLVSGSRTPRTIVCHNGGYNGDNHVAPLEITNGYFFTKWDQIDMFVYFSQYFVSVPPLYWINTAHHNGVQILGTLYTRRDGGVDIWNKIFGSKATCDECIDALVSIASKAHIDGWLLKVMNEVPVIRLPWLVRFVKKLTSKMHAAVPKSVVLWYDGVINNGKVKSQNELNDKNRMFFDVCDGIYVNYNWHIGNLRNTKENAGDRALDVYMGIDILGKTTRYKPGPDCAKAMSVAREKMLSIALFGINWTLTSIPKEPAATLAQRFRLNDKEFWDAIRIHLYTRIVISNTSRSTQTNNDL